MSLKFGKVRRFVRAGGFRLHFVEAGEGPPLLLIPPAFATWRYWRPLGDDLAERFHVLAVDLLGAGDSEKPSRNFKYTPQEQADILFSLLKALEIPQAHVIGASYGGSVAFALAGRHTERIGKAVVIEGFLSVKLGLPGWSRAEALALRTPLLGHLLIRLLKSEAWGLRAARSSAGVWWEQMREDERERWISYILEELKHADRVGWSGIRSSPFVTDEPGLQCDALKIRSPLLYIFGTSSAYFESLQPTLDFIRVRMPQVYLVKIPGGAHNLVWQNPERIRELILDFLTAR